MNVPVEEKKAEAIRRMKKMGVFPETIKQFQRDGLVSVSEPPVGAFFWLDEEQREVVKKFEEEHNALVFVGVRAYTSFGKMDSFLFVSDYKEEWGYDDADLDEGMAMTMTYNWDAPDCSEMGSIGFKLTIAAGIQRVW